MATKLKKKKQTPAQLVYDQIQSGSDVFVYRIVIPGSGWHQFLAKVERDTLTKGSVMISTPVHRNVEPEYVTVRLSSLRRATIRDRYAAGMNCGLVIYGNFRS